MKCLILILLLFATLGLKGQYRDYDNRFNQINPVQRDNRFRNIEVEEEKIDEGQNPEVDDMPQSGPGAPGEPTSIDQYSILLFGAAVVLFIFVKKKV